MMRAFLILLLSLLSLSAQLVERSFYAVQDLNGSSNIVYYKVFMSPGTVVNLTHDKANQCIGMWMQQRELSTNVSALMALDYYFGDPDAEPMKEYPTLLPYVPPQRTAAELAKASLMVSNKVWLASHPVIAPAKPKVGNRPVATKSVVSPMPPAIPAQPLRALVALPKPILSPPPGTPPTPIPSP